MVQDGDGVVIQARTAARQTRCTACNTWSERVHSRYRRRLRDALTACRPVVIELLVRRFHCDNSDCERVIFTEQVEGLTSRHAQRTPPLRAMLEAIGLALAGRAGARLATQIGARAGRSSLLRLIRALPEPEVGTVPVLGVDDFAFRRGHTYGTILIDMATHRPIDLHDGRDSAPLQAWLRAHPGVEVVCRDRSSSYADAVRVAAPDAIQVADRFHLWQNLIAAVEACLMRHRNAFDEPLFTPDQPAEHEPPAVEEPDEAAEDEPLGRVALRYRANHQTVHKLLAEGHSLRAIARHLGWSRHNVRKLARAERWKDLVVEQRPRGSKLDDFKLYLHVEWDAGRINATDLCQEIRAMGYQGSYAILAAYLRQYRPGELRKPGPIKTVAPPSIREVTGWFTRHPDRLSEADRLQLKTLLTRCPPLEEVHELVKSFATMMSEREGHRLPEWIDVVLASDHPSLRRFARGLRKDFDAVTAGLTLPHSSGAVEGNVNRLKMIKRKLYGRANLDLLRKLVLLNH
ncbi:ISL3 family transposase [Glycomyces buryatensis]|uniref:ISL3 family transposase n=1 Tax=Glycomyces buryatensis TaxID=2570927 RepID=A0A4S8QDQ3_9ACTN|nr:ISL3 family transposase [Glycomyces buryatensis]